MRGSVWSPVEEIDLAIDLRVLDHAPNQGQGWEERALGLRRHQVDEETADDCRLPEGESARKTRDVRDNAPSGVETDPALGTAVNHGGVGAIEELWELGM